MKKLRKHLSFANVASCLALFIALGGASYAAINLPKNSVGTKQIKRKAVNARKLRKNSVNSAKVKNHSLRAVDFRNGQLPAGPQGKEGPRGEPGPFPNGNLPSGKTLRGTYSIGTHQNTAGEYHNTAISFGFELSSAPTDHFIPRGTAPPPQCPGTTTQPEAQPGNLCVYEAVAGNQQGTPAIFNPTTALPGASRVGFGVALRGGASTSGNILSYGSWAVTSP